MSATRIVKTLCPRRKRGVTKTKISVRISIETIDNCREIAKKKGLLWSEVLREAMRLYVEKYGD